MKKFIFLILSVLIPLNAAFADGPVMKEPNVAGQFYPDNPQELSQMLDGFLSTAKPPASSEKIHLLFAPHAGYVYSGGVAAFSYDAVKNNSYSTIVIIGPSHYFDFEGASVWKEGKFKTPLGEIPIDEEFAAQLMQADPDLSFNRDVYEREHSLEVQMPFLQKTFSDFKIVPILMGQPDLKVCRNLSQALQKIIGDRDDVLIVISTDMSHYHDAAFAETMDHQTLETIKTLNGERLFTLCLLRKMELCGFTSAVTGLMYARDKGWNHVNVLKYAHSGDVTGDNERVVGYSAIVFTKGDPPPANSAQSDGGSLTGLTNEQKKKLLELTKGTITEYVKNGKTLQVKEVDPRLSSTEGAFVTIHKNGSLRGCIGSIIGRGPLYLTVRDMAIAAASADPRFKPVTPDELDSLEVEISVLSLPQPVNNPDEIILGTHGVILRRGNDHQGVFLPQVATETGWSKEEFLSQLCSQKAGLSRDCWKSGDVSVEVFTAEVFSDADIK